MTYFEIKRILDGNPNIRKYIFGEVKKIIKERYSEFVIRTELNTFRPYYIKKTPFEGNVDGYSLLNFAHSNYKVLATISNHYNITIDASGESWQRLVGVILDNISEVFPFDEKPFWYSVIQGTQYRGNCTEINTVKWLRQKYSDVSILNEGDTKRNTYGVDITFTFPNKNGTFTFQCKTGNVKTMDDFYRVNGIIQADKINTNYLSVQNDNHLYVFRNKGLYVNNSLYFHQSQVVDVINVDT